MKKNEEPKAALTHSLPPEQDETQHYFKFYLPPGAKFDEIYIDAQTACTELMVCKRLLTNMRKAGKLSYTYLVENGKI